MCKIKIEKQFLSFKWPFWSRYYLQRNVVAWDEKIIKKVKFFLYDYIGLQNFCLSSFPKQLNFFCIRCEINYSSVKQVIIIFQINLY